MDIEALAGQMEIQDIDRYQLAIPPWEVRLQQMSCGQFSASVDYILVNDILLYREHWSHTVLATGATPAGYFVFGGAASPGTRIVWCGSDLNARCHVFAPSSSETDFVIPADGHHVVMLVPQRLLLRFLGEELASIVLSDLRHLGSPHGEGNRLLDTIDRLIDKYLGGGGLLAKEHISRAIEWQLLGGLVEVLCTNSVKANCLPSRRRSLAVRRAIKYSDALRRPIKMSELAEAARVSTRTLELGFQETMATTPQEFMRWSRMNSVQRELAAARSGAASVTEVAVRWGFSELGRFAYEYKRLFGELPSTTLVRGPGGPAERFADILG